MTIFSSICERITKMSKVNHLTRWECSSENLVSNYLCPIAKNVSKMCAAKWDLRVFSPYDGSVTFVQWLVYGACAYKYNIWFSRFASERHTYVHTRQTAECVGVVVVGGVKINGICHIVICLGWEWCTVWGQRLCQQIASSWFIYQGLMHRVKMRDSATNKDYNGGIINIDTN